MVTLYIAQSLDGYIADVDGGIGWLDAVAAEGEDYGYEAFMAGVDALVMGRATYDQVRGFGVWPYGERPTAVLTSRPPDDDPPAGVTFMSRAPDSVLQAFPKNAHVWLVGGAGVIDAFQRADAIDRYVISVVPTLLGDGIPMFRAGQQERTLRLTGSKSFPSGLAQLTYERPRSA
ncbi:MAG: dihydrofolate reductase family protein [Bacteroidota bacterium]